jgi:hypothetical protein
MRVAAEMHEIASYFLPLIFDFTLEKMMLKPLKTNAAFAGLFAAFAMSTNAQSVAQPAAQSTTQSPNKAAPSVTAPAPAAPTKANPPPPPAPPANPRADIQENIARAVLATMAKSDDPRAIALSSKFARTMDTPEGKERPSAEQDDRQEAALAKALAMIDKPEHKSAANFVRFSVASFCNAFVERKLCAARDRMVEFANNDATNVVPWIMVAAREFAAGRQLEAQLFLDKAASAKSSTWYYQEAIALAKKYADSAKGVDAKFGDAAAVTFLVAGQVTLPEFRRYSQMCNPDAEGKLPEGRYQACRKVAALLQSGDTNVETIVGLRALERMALGENKADEAKQHADALTKFQGDISRLWREHLKFPPTNAADAARVTAFVADAASVGERLATITAQKTYFTSTASAAKP